MVVQVILYAIPYISKYYGSIHTKNMVAILYLLLFEGIKFIEAYLTLYYIWLLDHINTQLEAMFRTITMDVLINN